MVKSVYLSNWTITKEYKTMVKYLLNMNGSNAKILKSQKGTEYKIASLSLYPDIKICPAQIMADCKEPCLVSAGRGSMNSIKNIRQSKTDFWHNDKQSFIELLLSEMFKFKRRCENSGFKAAFRLNTISDIDWTKYIDLSLFNDCLLYDYTKIAARLKKPASNYNLIFSYSAAPKYQNQVKAALKTSAPIAAVFRGGLPKTFLGREVIDGDKSDLVNIKAFNKIVGLKLKGGKSIQSIKSPFVVDVVNGVAI